MNSWFPRKLSARREWLALAAILAAALFLRLRGIAVCLPRIYHPDEPKLVEVASGLSLGDLNPHFFHYPGGFFYALRLLWAFLGAERDDPASMVLSGRALVAVLGALTVFGVWLLGRRVSRGAGLMGAAVLALLPLHVGESRLVTVDVPLTCAVVFSLYFAGRLAQEGGWRNLVWAALLAGVAAAIKYNGALALVGVVVGALYQPDKKKLPAMLPAAVALAAASYLLLSPYTLLDWRGFWEGITFDRTHMATGDLGIPGGNGWLRAVNYGLLPAFLWLGLILAMVGGIRIVKGRLRALLPALVFAVVFFALLGSWKAYYLRYVDPLLPALALLIGAGATWLMPGRSKGRLANVGLLLCAVGLIVWYGYAAVSAPLPARAESARWQAEQWLLANAGGAAVAGDMYTPAQDLIVPNVWVRLRGQRPGYILDPTSVQGRFFLRQWKSYNEATGPGDAMPRGKRAELRPFPRTFYILEKQSWPAVAGSGVKYLVVSRELRERARTDAVRGALYDGIEQNARLVASFPAGDAWQVRIFEVAQRPPIAPPRGR